jgi:hypothetical protein
VLHSHRVPTVEEARKLLGVPHQDSESEEEVLTDFVSGLPSTDPPPPVPALHGLESHPPPTYGGPHPPPATLAPTSIPPVATPPTTVPLAAAAAAVPVLTNEAPPEYSLHAKGGPLPSKAGLAVQIQIDGKLVPGTVMEDVSQHICMLC